MIDEIPRCVDGDSFYYWQKKCHARIGLNWPQAVFQVVFSEETAANEVIMEEANEGEA